MLNAMREGAKTGTIKFILFGFMVLAVGGLVMTDVGGFFRGGVTKTAVAKIDGRELSIVTFDRMVRRILSRQGMDPETAYRLGLIDQILASEVDNNLMQRSARDLGLIPSEQTVLKQISLLVEPYVSETMDKKAALSAILRNQGVSEKDFVSMIRAQMSNTLLQNAVQIGGESGPSPEALDLYEYKNEKRTLNAVLLPHSDIKDVAEPTDDILLPFYQAGQERYAVPETRVFSIAFLSRDNLKEDVTVTEEELRETYERDIAGFSLPERRVIEQAVIETEAIATAVAAKVGKGQSLKDAVKEETGDEKLWLGEEKYEKAGLPEELAAAAFDAEKGALAGPVKSPLGWHVLVIKDVLPPSTRPFEEVKADLEKEIAALHAADAMMALANSVDDNLASGMTLEEVTEQMGLTVKKFGPIRQDGSTPDDKDGVADLGKDSAYAVETAFDLSEGEISSVVELSDGRYAAIRADTVNEKSYRPFEEVKAELSKIWIQDQKEVTNKLRALDAIKALNSGEKSLNTFGPIKAYELQRGNSPPEPMNDAGRDMFFELSVNDYGMTPVEDGFIVGQVTSSKLPDTAGLDEKELAPFVEMVRLGAQDEFLRLFMAHVRDSYDVRINKNLLDKTYGPGSEQL